MGKLNEKQLFPTSVEVGNKNTNTSFSGEIRGSGNLVKVGSGTLTFRGGLGTSADSFSVLAVPEPGLAGLSDSATSLQYLKRYYKLVILSNVDRDLLDHSIASIGVAPDLAVTAQDCGSYKPAPGHWERFLRDARADVLYGLSHLDALSGGKASCRPRPCTRSRQRP